MTVSNAPLRRLRLSDGSEIVAPLVWLGQSVRTTVVTQRYPELARECWMVSLGDAVHRPRLVERIFCGNLRGRLGASGPLMLDSGGFTMMMKEQSLKISEVARIYQLAEAEFCISLDVPATGKDNSRVRARKYGVTLENLAYLIEAIGRHKLVPVVHGSTEKEIAGNCCHIADIFPQPPVICIGGLVPLLRRSGRNSGENAIVVAWISKVIATVRSYFSAAMIHILGAGSPKNVAMVIRCGADSTDSLAWRRAAGFGTIYLPATSERFLGPRDRKRGASRPTLKRDEIELLARCLCPACVQYSQVEDRVALLANYYIARAAHNAFIIIGEAKRVALMR